MIQANKLEIAQIKSRKSIKEIRLAGENVKYKGKIVFSIKKIIYHSGPRDIRKAERKGRV